MGFQFKQAGAWIWFLVPAAVLMIGILPLPYGFYTLLRIVVTGAAALAAYLAYRKADRVDALVVISGLVGVLFNPLVPVFLDKGAWVILDLAAAAWFAFLAFRGAPASPDTKVQE